MSLLGKLRGLAFHVSHRLVPRSKGEHEFAYWKRRVATEGTLSNDHYVRFYTGQFGLTFDDYAAKRVLDIGCGPRGSLEWASMTLERVGLDPLADQYAALRTEPHAMTYVASGSEQIPFADGHFDVVSSFNSLDHVDDLDATIREIGRVVKTGGLFLLLTDVDHDPTPAEPIEFSFDIVERFTPPFELVEQHHYEKRGRGMYDSVEQAIAYDHSNPTRRYGILAAKFRRA